MVITDDSSSKLSDLGEPIRKSLVGVLEQIDQGFRKVMLMYTVAFYIGVALIILSVVVFLFGLGEKWSSLILGGIGITDIVTFFIFKPAEELQISRGNLAQLQAAFVSWVNDIAIWNQFLEIKSSSQEITIDEMEKISKNMITNTLKIIEGIHYSLEGKTKTDSKESLENIDRH